jgi:trigger factor
MASLQERAVELEDTAEGYAAQKQDSVFCNMLPYEELADGSRGSALPQMASGDDVEVVLSDERYMPGLVEGLVGVQAGQTREIRVQFPDNLRGPATALSGKRAIFDVEVSSVKKRIMPGMDDAFANKIRPGLTFDELKDEVLLAMNDEGSKKEAEARNKELDKALLEIIEAEIPETLLIEQTRQKFAVMMTEVNRP